MPKKHDSRTLQEYYNQARKAFHSYGLEVLRANDEIIKTWNELEVDIKKLKINKKYLNIIAIRNMNQKRFIKTKYHKSVYEHRLFLYDIGVITEDDVYAWFYDLVWRQNNNLVLKQTIKGSVWDYDYSGRWNKRRPFGYQVRKRLRDILVELENPVMLTLTIDSKKVFKEMSNNTNLDVVMYSISKIGKWIRKFNQAYYQYMKRNGIDWKFAGWVIEFQEKNNCGMPHVHMIFDGKWIGKISEIENLWGHGIVEITTKKDVQARYKGQNISNLRLANYLTKYVSKAGQAISEKGVHKGYAWLAFTGGRIFSVKHEKKVLTNE